MSSLVGAEIIPFPVRQPMGLAGSDPQERLRKALAALDTAMTEQKAAMAGWRDSLDQLKKSTQGLGLSMQRYRGSLDKLGADVADLHKQATQLESWADDALKKGV